MWRKEPSNSSWELLIGPAVLELEAKAWDTVGGKATRHTIGVAERSVVRRKVPEAVRVETLTRRGVA